MIDGKCCLLATMESYSVVPGYELEFAQQVVGKSSFRLVGTIAECKMELKMAAVAVEMKSPRFGLVLAMMVVVGKWRL